MFNQFVAREAMDLFKYFFVWVIQSASMLFFLDPGTIFANLKVLFTWF